MRGAYSQQELDQALADGAEWVVLRGDARYVVHNARVVAYGSSRVVAWGSSQVVAWGSSQVVAWGSSQVVAWDSSQVVARGSSQVEAYDSSQVVAGSHVPVQVGHKHDGEVVGGVRIDLPDPATISPADWCAYNGATVEGDHAVLYKAVDDNWHPRQTKDVCYQPGTTVTAPDYTDVRECGGGLHFGVTPAHASRYHYGASRWVACRVPLSTLVPLDDKCKAPSCQVLYEVTRGGDRVVAS